MQSTDTLFRSHRRVTSGLGAAIGLVASSLLGSPTALAYPVDPAKQAVNLPQAPDAARDFTLAYDTANKNIVYYAPKTGRTAALNGMPLVGFTVLPNGTGYLNAQLEFGVFGADRQKVIQAIQAAGKTPVIFPYRRTKIVPATPGIDPTTGQEICEETVDPSTGETVKECSGQIYKQLVFSTKGPSLGEFLGITAILKDTGAAVYGNLLRQGSAMQVNLEAEYYAAGTAFEATVTVKYDKLFENFRTYASFHGFLCTDIQVETFFEKETLCQGRRPEECGVWITFRDLVTGEQIETATIDPDNKEAQEKVLQAAERLADRLRDEMLAPIAAQLGPLDKSRPTGFKLDAKYERQQKGKNATFSFKSPNGVNVKETVLPIALGCVKLSPEGDISRNLNGDCAGYWQ